MGQFQENYRIDGRVDARADRRMKRPEPIGPLWPQWVRGMSFSVLHTLPPNVTGDMKMQYKQ